MQSESAPHVIPLTVIGGYLGAGKTTLLNHILTAPHGRRLAVIVNDFGSINIDAALITNRDGETINLANGCICCSLTGSLLAVLLDLKHRPNPPEHIIVEASGVADPHKIGQYGMGGSGIRLESILVAVDAETIRTRARDKYVGSLVVSQLSAADILILTKTDLINADEQRAVRAWILERAPRARIINAVHGSVPVEMVLGVAVAPRAAAAPDNAPAHTHDAQFETADFVSSQPFDADALREVLAHASPDVLRAKGFVILQNEPHRYVLQLVGARWSLDSDALWGEDAPLTQLVAIALADTGAAAHFVAQLQSALAPAQNFARNHPSP